MHGFTELMFIQKVVYVNDMLPDTEYPVAEAPAIRLQKKRSGKYPGKCKIS